MTEIVEYPKLDEEFGEMVFAEFMEHLVIPEVRKRQEAGLLARPLELRAAQIVFYPDGREPEVRINEEVVAVARVVPKPGVRKKAGEPVFEHEIDHLETVVLSEKDDPDCGHVTLVRTGKRWTLSFDFHLNKALSKKHVALAEQYLETARTCLSAGRWVPLVDNLFSAAELAARAKLLSHADAKFRQKASHKSIQARYGHYSVLGNVDQKYRETLNTLSSLRESRYLRKSLDLTLGQAEELVTSVQGMIEDAKRAPGKVTLIAAEAIDKGELVRDAGEFRVRGIQRQVEPTDAQP